MSWNRFTDPLLYRRGAPNQAGAKPYRARNLLILYALLAFLIATLICTAVCH